jgi:hypothetical protein
MSISYLADYWLVTIVFHQRSNLKRNVDCSSNSAQKDRGNGEIDITFSYLSSSEDDAKANCGQGRDESEQTAILETQP